MDWFEECGATHGICDEMTPLSKRKKKERREGRR